MRAFPFGHAAGTGAQDTVDAVLEQLRQRLLYAGYRSAPPLALVYMTDRLAPEAEAVMLRLREGLPQVHEWVGSVGVGIAATGIEYWDVPALAVLLCDITREQYRVFSGLAPLPPGGNAFSALVHADPHTPELTALLGELAQRTRSGYLFGGVSSSRGEALQFVASGARPDNGVLQGGLSGVAFDESVRLVSRVTQGCLPLAGTHTISAAQQNLVLRLDGRPALDVLLEELEVTLAQSERALQAMRRTLAGLVSAPTGEDDGVITIERTGNFGAEVRVRHIIGIDPGHGAVALADQVEAGMELAFCQRNAQAARVDLTRICAEIREELEPSLEALEPALPAGAEAPAAPGQAIAGALYISCAGRGGQHFGAEHAELQIVRRALGDVPLIGFFAGGEIARHNLYGYTGVLTAWAA